jgi:hypothetical protein
VVRQPDLAPVAATGNIDAAMNAAKHTASASDLEAGSREIMNSWAAQRGHHKHAFGQSYIIFAMQPRKAAKLLLSLYCTPCNRCCLPGGCLSPWTVLPQAVVAVTWCTLA